MTESASRPSASRVYVRAVLLSLLVVTLLKIIWALNSAGSVDMVLFYNFGKGVEQYGLTELYKMDEKFNHTPLTGGFAWLLYHIAGNDKLMFAFLLRLAGIIADVAVVAALLRWRAKLGHLPAWWALIVFTASPVSLMVSGFHGNVDPVMVALLFLATLAAVIERPVLCGVLFGLAANVKIVPIIVSPVFFFFWLGRANPLPGLLRFMVASGSVMLAGWSLPLIVCPQDYLHNVFGYGSTWGVWGVPYFLRFTGWDAVQKIGYTGLSTAQNAIAAVLKVAAIGGIFTVGWLRRKAKPAEFAATVGIAWLVFFICAPGVGVQYMVWPAPFLLLLTARGFAVFTAAATAFLFAFYQTASVDARMPWFFANPSRAEMIPLWSAWAMPAWLAFCGTATVLVRQRWRAVRQAV